MCRRNIKRIVHAVHITAAVALCTAVLLASCSEDSVPESDKLSLTGQTEVGFTFSTQAMTTKGGATGEMSDALLKTEGAGVFAYYTGATPWATAGSTATPNFMYNQYIFYESVPDKWYYEPVKYWPNDNATADNAGATGSQEHAYLSFFAYAPYVSSSELTGNGIVGFSANSATGAPTVSYKLADEAANQVDLLWGTRKQKAYSEADGSAADTDAPAGDAVNTDLTKQTTGETVDFLFKHALASIDIYVQRVFNEVPPPTPRSPATDKTRVFVNSLSLAVESPNTMPTEGTFNLETGAWSGLNAVQKTITISGARLNPALRGTEKPNSELGEVQAWELNSFDTRDEGGNLTHPGVTETATRITPNTQTYATMLIPVAGGIKVKPGISYSFVTQDDEELLGLPNALGTHRYVRVLQNVTGSNVTVGTRSGASEPYTYTLERGKRYVLKCYIGVETVEFVLTGVEKWDFPIRMTTTVTPFVDDYKEDDGTGGTSHTVNEQR